MLFQCWLCRGSISLFLSLCAVLSEMEKSINTDSYRVWRWHGAFVCSRIGLGLCLLTTLPNIQIGFDVLTLSLMPSDWYICACICVYRQTNTGKEWKEKEWESEYLKRHHFGIPCVNVSILLLAFVSMLLTLNWIEGFACVSATATALRIIYYTPEPARVISTIFFFQSGKVLCVVCMRTAARSSISKWPND